MLPAAVNVPLTVAEPVDVSVATVAEPALIVPVVLTLIVPDKSAVLIEPSSICALPTELAPTVDGTFVSCDPSPINPVAVTVPMTCSVVEGVVVPMPTLPDVVAMVAVPVIASVDAVTEPVAVSVDTVV